MQNTISSTQKGFLKGRFIGENTRLVFDMIDYLKRENKTGILLLIDFEKAFDTLEWSYIENVLNTYKFGENFRKYINLLYKDAESCVINNGNFSEFFKLGRGCRQGDSISPYIFILGVEPLAAEVKNNAKVKGI